jgi:hypothetical protein
MSDMDDWVSAPGAQGSYYDHPGKHEEDQRFTQDALEADRGSLSLLMLPLAFFVMPGRFMRSFGAHLGTTSVFILIWITGIASTANSLENRTLFGSSNTIAIDSWGMFWGVCIFAGILRGYVIYGLGGLWYRLRLRMCGFDGAEWKETGRIYMVSGAFKQGVFVIYMAYASTQFASFESYLQDDSASLWFTFGFVGFMLLSQVCASITLFVGSVAVFPLNRVWAAVWLLVLPVLLRGGATAGIFAAALLGTLTPTPEVGNPSTFSGTMIQMEYPRNWTVYEDDRKPGPHLWVQSAALIGDAIIEVEIVYDGSAEEMFTYAEQDWLERVDYDLGEIRDEGVTRYAGRQCTQRDRSVSLSGTNYVMKLLHWELGDRCGVLVSMIAPSSAWDTAEVGFEHVLRTLKVQDPMKTGPDLVDTYTARFEEIQFQMPGNWWLERQLYDDITHEDGSVSPGTRYIESEAPGNAVFRGYLYASDMGPRAELAGTIESYTADGRLENEQSFGEWNGMSGFGATGQAQLGDLLYHVMIFVTELEDGRLLEVRTLNEVGDADIHRAGLDLIEDSFRLSTPDPDSEPATP